MGGLYQIMFSYQGVTVFDFGSQRSKVHRKLSAHSEVPPSCSICPDDYHFNHRSFKVNE